MLHVYNTLYSQKELFRPFGRKVKVYACGPTVYNYAHIGNFRTYVCIDAMVKALKFLWYDVVFVMNITDIDDKTIRESQKQGKTLKDLTQFYTQCFQDDLKKLYIEFPDFFVPISSLIPEMQRMIQWLVTKGYAYIAEDGSIYYNIAKFKQYGELARIDMSWLQPWKRVSHDEYEKEQVSDFVLWKAYKPEDGENVWHIEIEWNGTKKIFPWRPGWHIECSACNMKYHGAQIDIHFWWIDLIFPHHQNEIAQTEAFTGKKFCKYWIHVGHLLVDGKKMSKSAGNFYTLQDIETHFSHIKGEKLWKAMRFLFLYAKHGENLDFSFQKLESALSTVESIQRGIEKVKWALQYTQRWPFGVRKEFQEKLQYYIQEYVASLEDNFNFLQVFHVFFEFLSYSNSMIDEGVSYDEAKALLEMYRNFQQVFSFFDLELSTFDGVIYQKLEARNQLKQQKNYMEADKLREELLKEWYRIVDTKHGSYVERIV